MLLSSAVLAIALAACVEQEPGEPDPDSDSDSASAAPIRVEEEDGREDPAPVSVPAARFATEPQIDLGLLPIDEVHSNDRSHLPGTSYCPNPNQVWSQLPIPVWLNATTADEICAKGASCPSISQIENELKTLLAEEFYASGSNIRFAYKGLTTLAPQTVIPDAIHIFALPCCTPGETCTSRALASYGPADSGSDTPEAKIRICTDNADGPIRWAAYLNTEGRSLHAVLLHEIGHSIGLHHTDDCAFTDTHHNSVMDVYRSAQRSHLGQPDIDFLRDTYGTRADLISVRTSTTGLTWTEATNNKPARFTNVRGRVSATATANAGSDLVIGYLTDDGQTPTVHVERRTSSGGWSELLRFPTVSYFPPAVAKRSNSVQHVVFPYMNNADFGIQRIYSKKTLDGGATWTGYQLLSDTATQTRQVGVATAFDHASVKFVTLWQGSPGTDGAGRQLDDAIVYRVEGGSTVYTLVDPVTGNPIQASDTPSVACAEASWTGIDNCMLVWVNPGWSHTVRWMQFHIAGEQIVAGSIHTHGYFAMGSPSVSYATGTSANTSYVWHLALTQGGTTIYTWHKVGPSTTGWVDQRSFSESPMASLPIAGADGSGIRYTLLTDQ